MGKIIKFGGTQLGDTLLFAVNDDEPVTPLRIVPGVGRPTASIVDLGVNMVYRIAAAVRITRTSPEALYAAVKAIRALLKTTGVIQIYADDGTTLKIDTASTWWLAAVSRPQIEAGFAGRLCTLELEFMGETPSVEH